MFQTSVPNYITYWFTCFRHQCPAILRIDSRVVSDISAQLYYVLIRVFQTSVPSYITYWFACLTSVPSYITYWFACFRHQCPAILRIDSRVSDISAQLYYVLIRVFQTSVPSYITYWFACFRHQCPAEPHALPASAGGHVSREPARGGADSADEPAPRPAHRGPAPQRALADVEARRRQPHQLPGTEHFSSSPLIWHIVVSLNVMFL